MSNIKISLAAARVNAKLTQSEVAQRIHVSKNTIVYWENGKVEIPFTALNTLCGMYKIPMDNILLPTKST